MTLEPNGVRVRTHPALCNGCGNCHRFAPEVYTLDDEGYIGFHLLDVPSELAPAARLGADVCPEKAITVIEPALTNQTLTSHNAATPITGLTASPTDSPGA